MKTGNASFYPLTELVILAGGQARRMQGKNKLLQHFDSLPQLHKIYRAFAENVHKVWVNSHRDHAQYLALQPDIEIFQDEQAGFWGPLMGMKSAWSFIRADHILFVPCDITYIAPQAYGALHQALMQQPSSSVAYIVINQQPLYPFCLMKREAVQVLQQQIAREQLSLKRCFDQLNSCRVELEHRQVWLHSINSEQELSQYQHQLHL